MIINGIIASQVAGIMIGQSTVQGLFQFNFTGLDEFIDEFGMMGDLVISPHLRIFMLQRIETMGTRSDYFFNLIVIILDRK